MVSQIRPRTFVFVLLLFSFFFALPFMRDEYKFHKKKEKITEVLLQFIRCHNKYAVVCVSLCVSVEKAIAPIDNIFFRIRLRT